MSSRVFLVCLVGLASPSCARLGYVSSSDDGGLGASADSSSESTSVRDGFSSGDADGDGGVDDAGQLWDTGLPDADDPDTASPADAEGLDAAPIPDVRDPDTASSVDADGADAVSRPDADVLDGDSGEVFDGGSGAIAFVDISAGTYFMGSPTSELCRDELTETRHEVTLTRGFEMQATETTEAQFSTMTGRTPRTSVCPDCPAIVTWYAAAYFCNALSGSIGETECYSCRTAGQVTCENEVGFELEAILDCPGYRLPTDAEWEYAYRADSDTAFYLGEITDCDADPIADLIAWYLNNADGFMPVGRLQPNDWGLYDMAGNAIEWGQDDWRSDLGTAAVRDPLIPPSGSENYHILRGGGVARGARYQRAAVRLHELSNAEYGFRCVRTTSWGE